MANKLCLLCVTNDFCFFALQDQYSQIAWWNLCLSLIYFILSNIFLSYIYIYIYIYSLKFHDINIGEYRCLCRLLWCLFTEKLLKSCLITFYGQLSFLLIIKRSLVFHIIVIILLAHIFTPVVTGGFHWSQSDSKSPQLSRTLLSILTNLNSAVVWMVSILVQISCSSHFFLRFLKIVQRASTMIGITVTFIFNSF